MIRTAVACVLLAIGSCSAIALQDRYTEPHQVERGRTDISGRYVPTNGDRNHIYAGKRVLAPDSSRQGREAGPYSLRRNEQRTNHMREYERQRQR